MYTLNILLPKICGIYVKGQAKRMLFTLRSAATTEQIMEKNLKEHLRVLKVAKLFFNSFILLNRENEIVTLRSISQEKI